MTLAYAVVEQRQIDKAARLEASPDLLTLAYQLMSVHESLDALRDSGLPASYRPIEGPFSKVSFADYHKTTQVLVERRIIPQFF